MSILETWDVTIMISKERYVLVIKKHAKDFYREHFVELKWKFHY